MADQGGVIGFYSPDEEPQPWKSRLELDLPEFRFELLENVSDVLSEGDIIKVKLIGFDRGKMKLSKKAIEE